MDRGVNSQPKTCWETTVTRTWCRRRSFHVSLWSLYLATTFRQMTLLLTSWSFRSRRSRFYSGIRCLASRTFSSSTFRALTTRYLCHYAPTPVRRTQRHRFPQSTWTPCCSYLAMSVSLLRSFIVIVLFIGPIPWGHSGPLCHALSLLLLSSALSWTSMRRRRATVVTPGEWRVWRLAVANGPNIVQMLRFNQWIQYNTSQYNTRLIE